MHAQSTRRHGARRTVPHRDKPTRTLSSEPDPSVRHEQDVCKSTEKKRWACDEARSPRATRRRRGWDTSEEK
eukprot:1460672-Prymnesium_polylepis.1